MYIKGFIEGRMFKIQAFCLAIFIVFILPPFGHFQECSLLNGDPRNVEVEHVFCSMFPDKSCCIPAHVFCLMSHFVFECF